MSKLYINIIFKIIKLTKYFFQQVSEISLISETILSIIKYDSFCKMYLLFIDIYYLRDVNWDYHFCFPVNASI